MSTRPRCDPKRRQSSFFLKEPRGLMGESGGDGGRVMAREGRRETKSTFSAGLLVNYEPSAVTNQRS